VKRNGEEVSGVAHISSGRVVDFAADALVETVVAGFSYAIEIRAQIIEDLDELSGFLLREEDYDEERRGRSVAAWLAPGEIVAADRSATWNAKTAKEQLSREDGDARGPFRKRFDATAQRAGQAGSFVLEQRRSGYGDRWNGCSIFLGQAV
jgi:hypothetical protein